jgi:tetratricopeptide (TPR) repeat protein
MSDGYAALDEGGFDAARDAFERAQALRPGSAEAQAGLQEVAAAETASRLRGLQVQAENRVEAEDWDGAVKAYEAALAIDGSVLFAQRGLAEAQPRAALDARLEQALEDPDRLADETVAAEAQQMLDYARRLEPRGPRLARQIDALGAQLERANTPVRVTLRSDGETQVTVYRIARLGQFDERTLTLRPGEYTAVGTRPGYRDVRRTFRISPESPPPAITVACTEAI